MSLMTGPLWQYAVEYHTICLVQIPWISTEPTGFCFHVTFDKETYDELPPMHAEALQPERRSPEGFNASEGINGRFIIKFLITCY